MEKRAYALAFAIFTYACGDSPASPGQPTPTPGAGTRTYNLAFTPFPYLLNATALEYTFTQIGSDADMIAQHLESYGVPWPEAVTDTFPYNANLMSEWVLRKARTRGGHRVYLALNPMSQSRNGLASLWAANGSDRPLPAPWNGYALNDPQVKLAFLNYARRAITYFDPDYVTLGIEVNQMMAVAPNLWPLYLDLHRSVYQSLKSLYPSLPIMVSLDANHLLGYSGVDAASQTRARTEIAAFSDYFCLSLYLYMGSNAGGSFPADAFDRLAALTTKPIAICETGYPSRDFQLRAPGSPVVRGNPNAQSLFIDRLFEAADRYSFRFIVHFFLRDLDDSLDFSDVIRTFRYDGLYDANGVAKPALARWKEKLSLERRSLTADDTAPAWDGPPVPAEPDGGGDSTSIPVRLETGVVYANDNLNGPNTVSAFSIGDAGELTTLAGSPFATGGAGTGLWMGVLNDIVVAPQGFLYAANHQSGDISVFSIEATTGSVTTIMARPFEGPAWTSGPIALAVDPAGRFLAAGHAPTGTVVTFSIATDGSLSPRAPATAVGGPPTMLKVSPDGRLLAVTLENDGRIAVFRVAADGAVAPVTGSPFFGRTVNATSVDFGCGNGLLYAANGVSGGRTSTALETFRVDVSGALDPIGGSLSAARVNGSVVLVNPTTGSVYAGNQGLAISGSGRFLLAANHSEARGTSSSIGVFAVASDGALSPGPGSPFPVSGSSLSSLATFPPPRCLP
jgi:hypothetical protein